MKKVRVEKLPETKDVEGVKRWVEEKGEFAQISYGEPMRHIAVFELKAGHWRGNHYHEKKEETFYVVSGKMRALFRDLDTEEQEELMLGRGDRLHVGTRCAHIFYGLEDALVVEYSPQKYEKNDAFKAEFNEG
jgi:dTDP-4-dehydrorhamnose 3,5-epimerase-like enzyme